MSDKINYPYLDFPNVIDITLKSSEHIYIGEILDINKFSDWRDIEKEIVSKYNSGKKSKDWNILKLKLKQS